MPKSGRASNQSITIGRLGRDQFRTVHKVVKEAKHTQKKTERSKKKKGKEIEPSSALPIVNLISLKRKELKMEPVYCPASSLIIDR